MLVEQTKWRAGEGIGEARYFPRNDAECFDVWHVPRLLLISALVEGWQPMILNTKLGHRLLFLFSPRLLFPVLSSPVRNVDILLVAF